MLRNEKVKFTFTNILQKLILINVKLNRIFKNKAK